MTWTNIIPAATFVVMFGVGGAQAQEKKVEATIVKYDGLKQEVQIGRASCRERV